MRQEASLIISVRVKASTRLRVTGPTSVELEVGEPALIPITIENGVAPLSIDVSGIPGLTWDAAQSAVVGIPTEEIESGLILVRVIDSGDL